MEAWVIWIIVALVFFMVEMMTAGVAVICFSVGALLAALVCAFTPDYTWQIASFAVGTILAFIFLRPLFIRWFLGKTKEGDKTNADALIGRSVMVAEKIDNDAHTGRVVIDGVTWRAVSQYDKTTYEVGSQVEIVSIDSIILSVK